MHFSTFLKNFDKWPYGSQGPLLVKSGTKEILSSGLIYDYSSITVETEGELIINGDYLLTVLGSRGPLVINGKITAEHTNYQNENVSHSTELILPDQTKIVLNSGNRASGGAGGMGGRGATGGFALGGSPGVYGRGGGGGGGTTYGGTGSPKPVYPPENGTTRPFRFFPLGAGGNGGDGNDNYNSSLARGQRGHAGGGMGGSVKYDDIANFPLYVGGGGGGGGGEYGNHGLPLWIKTWHQISGTGSINLNGKPGSNGGNGGNGRRNYYPSSGGGGGGGGGGGNAGSLWTHSKEMSCQVSMIGGSGGRGGAGGTANQGWNGTAGVDGQPGSHGIHTNIILTS